MRLSRPLACTALVLTASFRLVAIRLTPTDLDVTRALKIAAQPADARARFHAPYVKVVNSAAVEQIDVVTEFRRYVLVTEQELLRGNWVFSQSVSDARAAVRPWRGSVSVAARIRFHPQNMLTTVPPYDITVGDPPLAVLNVARTPINGTASGRPGDQFAPLLGAIVGIELDAMTVGQAARVVGVWLNGKPLTRATFDFSTLE